MSLDLYSSMFSFVILMILVLVGVAFLTLLERKVLGYIQIRKGPNKVGFYGLLQPFSDAVKLFTKETTYPLKSNYLVYYLCPMISFMLIFLGWVVCPFIWILMNFNFGLLFFMVCLSLGVYSIMVAGWSSNSTYALLGGLRSVAQTISYEVSLAFLFMCMLSLLSSYSFLDFIFYQKFCWFIFISLPIFFMFYVSLLAETNRTPFDFAEGESELVSGFNVEYSSGGFALIFLAEYSSILFMSLIFSVVFLGGNLKSFMFFVIVGVIGFSFIWVRGTLPRYRYDKLMDLCWKKFLPCSLFLLLFYFFTMMMTSVLIF
uniref:NADH-ubiquinone oxidoreductase chain 1 n=1 Tax=Lachesilla anna TaxID=239245 RepID=A0A343QCH3_9NEOP|nr:NADH dehydrogenase subunit 1 [Lachesilla anna]ATU07120.1 NADH dehydrogenase subunit 1 [Lachesilla anna]